MIRLGAAIAALAGAVGLGALVAWWLRPEVETEPKVERDPELDRHGQKALFDKILETATGSIDRAKNAATFVQGAAAAVATLYTGALSLVFVAEDDGSLIGRGTSDQLQPYVPTMWPSTSAT